MDVDAELTRLRNLAAEVEPLRPLIRALAGRPDVLERLVADLEISDPPPEDVPPEILSGITDYVPPQQGASATTEGHPPVVSVSVTTESPQEGQASPQEGVPPQGQTSPPIPPA